MKTKLIIAIILIAIILAVSATVYIVYLQEENGENGNGNGNGDQVVYSPTSFTAATISDSRIDLSWMMGSNADYTHIEWNNVQNWLRGEGYNVNDPPLISGVSFQHTSLLPETTFYYRAWGYKTEGEIYSIDSATTSATTDEAGPYCGDGLCLNEPYPGENCKTCPEDCGTCVAKITKRTLGIVYPVWDGWTGLIPCDYGVQHSYWDDSGSWHGWYHEGNSNLPIHVEVFRNRNSFCGGVFLPSTMGTVTISASCEIRVAGTSDWITLPLRNVDWNDFYNGPITVDWSDGDPIVDLGAGVYAGSFMGVWDTLRLSQHKLIHNGNYEVRILFLAD